MTVERVGVSFEPDLLEKFDTLIRKKGYTNRSEAIRDLVRKSLIESEVEEEQGDIFGTLTIIYDHHVGDVIDRLMHLQHHHLAEILTTTHIHVDEHICLEVMIVKGNVKAVRKLTDNVKAVRGVKHGGLIITKTSF